MYCGTDICIRTERVNEGIILPSEKAILQVHCCYCFRVLLLYGLHVLMMSVLQEMKGLKNDFQEEVQFPCKVSSPFFTWFTCFDIRYKRKEMQQLSIPLFSISSPLLVYNGICICVFHSTLHSVPALRFPSWNMYIRTYVEFPAGIRFSALEDSGAPYTYVRTHV